MASPHPLAIALKNVCFDNGCAVAQPGDLERWRPPRTCALNTYGHVIEELEGAVTVSAEDAIRRARAKFVRTTA